MQAGISFAKTTNSAGILVARVENPARFDPTQDSEDGAMCTEYIDPMPTDMPALLGRRGFLKGAAAAALAVGMTGTSALRAAAAPAAPTGTTAASDGTDPEPAAVPLDSISIQLYMMRSLMTNDATVRQTFSGLADIGYRKVEHAGFAGLTAPQFRAALDTYGLRSTSGHQNVPFPFDELAWRKTVDNAYIVGQSFIVEPLPTFALPSLITGVPMSSVVWGQYAEAINKAAAIAKIYGIRVGYHNHNVEFIPLPDAPGKTGYDILLAETDPALVHFEMDLYWVWKAGRDPVPVLQANPTRFRQFHVKDMDAAGGITAPGKGLIDFGRIFRAAHSMGIEEFTIEQDNAGAQAMTTAQLGYALLRDLRW